MCLVKTHDDPQEFARLVRRWEEPVHRLCVRMIGDSERGEDLKQEVFLRVFQKRKDYEVTAKFSTFLWRVAINLCRDELRRQQCRLKVVAPAMDMEGQEQDWVSEAPGPDTRTVQAEEGEMVRHAVMSLPEIYRSVIVLRHYEGLRLADIAEILDLPEGTVNSRMAEALERLSRALRPKLRPDRQAINDLPHSAKGIA
jgi:RNA polymerase sigma-70 factor (ECF subfamily)